MSPLFGGGQYVDCSSTLKPVESPTIKTFHREQKRQSFIEKNANRGLNMLCSERQWRIMVCLIDSSIGLLREKCLIDLKMYMKRLFTNKLDEEPKAKF